MTDKKFYTCEYCFKEFEPKRRRVQKYCSNTCRSKAHHLRKTKDTQLPTEKSTGLTIPKDIPTPSKEKMSLAGVGNAAAGNITAEALKSLFTKESNKPATKGDLTKLIEKLNGRYHLITNMIPDRFGRHPYYDMVEGVLVYLRDN